jgi:hypothetical protein
MADFDTNILSIHGIYKLFMPFFDTIKAFIRVMDSSIGKLPIAVQNREVILIKKDLAQQLFS